jgi:membrane protein YdbS with pleckstrin-like domain
VYNSFRQLCERLLRIPHDPAPPPGDEAATRIFNAAPNFYKYLLFLWGLKTAGVLFIICVPVGVPLGVAAVALSSQGKPAGWLLLIIPALVLAVGIAARLVALAILRLEFEKRWYVITDRSLRIREGVVAVSEMTVNFANVQNLSVSQGPIQRALGIADLQVETAGGGGAVRRDEHVIRNLHTAVFRGIANAQEIRDLIQERLKGLRDAGLGDPEDVRAAAPAPRGQLVAGPQSENALRQVLAEATALRRALERRAY